MDQKQKMALITGSTKGLGLQIAKLLAMRGYKIILTGRTQEALEHARQQLMRSSEHVLFCGDLLVQQEIQALCEVPFLPDIIIHNLGGKVDGDEQPLRSEILSKSIALNLGSAVAINSYYLSLMQKIHSGRIIHISSDASETGRCAPGLAAAKGAVDAYVKSSARFYAHFNIMICAVLPGIFLHSNNAWDQKRKTQPEYFQKKLSEMPLGRFLSAEEVASPIVDIATSDSMTYSGSLIKLTGGY